MCGVGLLVSSGEWKANGKCNGNLGLQGMFRILGELAGCSWEANRHEDQ